MRRLARLLVIPALLVVAAFGWDRLTYTSEPWLADLATLEDSLAAGYANLDHQVARELVDPIALHARTDSALRAARSGRDATAALRAFATAFQDGHLSVSRPTPAVVQWLEDRFTGRQDAPPLRTASADEGCRALGYRADGDPSLLALADGWTPVAGGHGTLRIGAASVGVLRIASFGVDRHLDACERAWPVAATTGEGATCDDACAEALWMAAADTILADQRRAIAALRAAGATHLVVDITGNGGGNDWVSASARQVTARDLPGHTLARIRHPHHDSTLARAEAALVMRRAEATDSAWAEVVEAGLSALRAQLAEVRAPCDRRAIWRTRGAAPCPVLALHTFTTGWVASLPPALAAHPQAAELFHPRAFRYEVGAWDGPLTILMDRRTASASEDFVVSLADHGAATTVGERTHGAGCGYTNGGIGFRLPHSGLVVRMPDCARIRANGENEVTGIAPDVAAGWERSDPEVERARKAVVALRKVVSR